MRTVIAVVIAIFTLAVLATPSQARHRHHHYYSGHYGRYLAQHYRNHERRRYAWRHRHRHYDNTPPVAHRGLSRPCQIARSMGGPCGCVAEEIIFGRSDHVLNGFNLWLANEWLRFPRALPRAGTAAVWPGRHVEAVVAVNGNGSVTTNGPYGLRRVSLSRVVIVDPRAHHKFSSFKAVEAVRRPRTYQWAGAVPL
jgi:hypothetical protein